MTIYKSDGTLAAVGQTVVMDAEYANSALVHIRGGAVAATGVTLAFEASVDSTNGQDGAWFAVLGARTNENTSESVYAATGTIAVASVFAFGYRLNITNARYFRVRMTGRTAGDIAVAIRGSEAAVESVPISFATANPSPTGTAVLDPSTASTNIASLRTTATDVYEITISNPTATAAFIKLYNKATAPVLATDVPVLTIPVAANSYEAASFGFLGKRFASGLGIAITGAAPATDTTNAPAGVVVHLTRG